MTADFAERLPVRKFAGGGRFYNSLDGAKYCSRCYQRTTQVKGWRYCLGCGVYYRIYKPHDWIGDMVMIPKTETHWYVTRFYLHPVMACVCVLPWREDYPRECKFCMAYPTFPSRLFK